MHGEDGERKRGMRGEERHTGHGEMWKRMKDGQNNSSKHNSFHFHSNIFVNSR